MSRGLRISAMRIGDAGGSRPDRVAPITRAALVPRAIDLGQARGVGEKAVSLHPGRFADANAARAPRPGLPDARPANQQVRYGRVAARRKGSGTAPGQCGSVRTGSVPVRVQCHRTPSGAAGVVSAADSPETRPAHTRSACPAPLNPAGPVVVVADPHHRDVATGESGEPAIAPAARRPRLARRVQGGRKPGARAAPGTLSQRGLERRPQHVDVGRLCDLLDGQAITCERASRGTGDLPDAAQGRPEALVGQGLIHLGDLERAELERAEQQGRQGPDRTRDSKPFDHPRHPPHSDRESESRRRRVAREGKRPVERHGAQVVAVMIAGRPLAAGRELDRHRDVLDRARERVAAFEGREKERGLDQRADRTPRVERAIEPARPRPAVSDHGQHLAIFGASEECRALEDAGRQPSPALRRVQLARQQSLGAPLHVRIEGGEYPKSCGAKVHVPVVARELAAHEIDEGRMGRRAARRLGPYAEGTRLGRVRLRAADDAPPDHHVEHEVAPPERPLRPPPRAIGGGAAGEPDEERGLRKVQLVDAPPEVEPRGEPEAVNRAPSLLAEVDLVQVRLEQLLLGVMQVEQYRHEGLGALAPQRPFGGEEEVLGELLGQGTAALYDAAGTQVRPPRPRDGEEGDSVMLEEAVIFHRHQARDQHRRRLRQPEHHPILMVTGIDAADEGRVQPGERRGTPIRGERPHDAPRIELDADPAGRLDGIPESELARPDDETATVTGVASGTGQAVFAVVAGARELVLERRRIESGARPDLRGAGVHPCGKRPPLVFELRANPDVEPRRVAGENDEPGEGHPPPHRPQEPPAAGPPRPRSRPRRPRLAPIAAGASLAATAAGPGPATGPGAPATARTAPGGRWPSATLGPGRSFVGLCHRRSLLPNGPAIRPGRQPTASPQTSLYSHHLFDFIPKPERSSGSR